MQKKSKAWLNHLVVALKGMWIGGTMTVPGVSGGSMAILLGIYDRLIFSISKFTKDIKNNIIFLVEFVLGAGVGLVLFSQFILMLLQKYTMPTSYFFLGAVAGGIPLIIKEANIKKSDFLNKKTGKYDHYTVGKIFLYILYAFIGIGFVYLISLIPEGVFAANESGIQNFLIKIAGGVIVAIALVLPGISIGIGFVYLISLIPEGVFAANESGIQNFLIKIAGGVIVAIALVLPGISVSQMLLMLGLYEEVFGSIKNFDILPLIPLGIGLVAGIILSTLAIGKAIEKHPQATYIIVFGFVLGSLPELFPGMPNGSEIFVCLLTAILGFAVIMLIMKGSDAADKASKENLNE